MPFLRSIHHGSKKQERLIEVKIILYIIFGLTIIPTGRMRSESFDLSKLKEFSIVEHLCSFLTLYQVQDHNISNCHPLQVIVQS